MDSVLLKVQKLSYSYHTLNGETPALDRVSFCLYRKEFLAIVGPSGCGKSTILSLIAGLLTPRAAAASRFMGKMVISPASATCCSTIFYLNGETSGKMLRSDWKSPTRIPSRTWNAFAGCSPTTGFWNFSIKSRLSFPAACANGLPSSARWRSSPISCCSMSRFPRWITRPG